MSHFPSSPGLRRLAVMACAAVAATGTVLGLGATGVGDWSAHAATAGASPAISNPGGPITKAQILSRMKNWYDRKPAYSQTTYIWDQGDTRKYRTDCSGFADMALHLKYDWNTSSLPTSNSITKRHDMNHDNRGWFTPANVQTGDVFDDTTDGHDWVFASWNSNGTFNYYNFGGGSSGHAPPEYHTGARMTDSELGYENSNNYFVLRFKYVTG